MLAVEMQLVTPPGMCADSNMVKAYSTLPMINFAKNASFGEAIIPEWPVCISWL